MNDDGVIVTVTLVSGGCRGAGGGHYMIANDCNDKRDEEEG